MPKKLSVAQFQAYQEQILPFLHKINQMEMSITRLVSAITQLNKVVHDPLRCKLSEGDFHVLHNILTSLESHSKGDDRALPTHLARIYVDRLKDIVERLAAENKK